MTIRLRGGSMSPVTPGIWVFSTSQWMIIIDCLHVELVSVPGVLDLQLGLMLLYTFCMYICNYVSLCSPVGTGDRLSVHKTFRRHSMTTDGRRPLMLLCKQGLIQCLAIRLYVRSSFCLLTHLGLNNIRARGVFNKNRLRKYSTIGDKQLQKNERNHFEQRSVHQAKMLCSLCGW